MAMQTPKPFSTPDEFNKEAVRHIETTLARSLYNCDELAAYSGTALAFRDRLVLDWNNTQQQQTFADQKRVYCKLSFATMPRAMGTDSGKIFRLSFSWVGRWTTPCSMLARRTLPGVSLFSLASAAGS
jgi:hypothetical protein